MSLLSNIGMNILEGAFGSTTRKNKEEVKSSFIARVFEENGKKTSVVMPFQFLPDTIQESKAAVYGDIVTIGRSSPIKTYSHSGAESLAFTLKFFASPEQGDTKITPDLIRDRVNFCKSLLYPRYKGFVIKPPPICLVRIGDSTLFGGVCKSVSNTVTADYPWDVSGRTLPHGVAITLVFEELQPIPLSMEQVSYKLADSKTLEEVEAGLGYTGGGLFDGLLGSLFGSLDVDSIINILVSSGVQGNLQGGLNTVLSTIGFNGVNALSNSTVGAIVGGIQSIPGVNNIPGVGGVTSYLSGNLSNLVSTNVGNSLSGLFGRR